MDTTTIRIIAGILCVIVFGIIVMRRRAKAAE